MTVLYNREFYNEHMREQMKGRFAQHVFFEDPLYLCYFFFANDDCIYRVKVNMQEEDVYIEIESTKEIDNYTMRILRDSKLPTHTYHITVMKSKFKIFKKVIQSVTMKRK